MNQPLLAILLLLTAAVATVAVMRRFHLPSMLGYLAIGMALGPHGFALLAESAEVESFAEFGVVFLMFSIGLEFSLKRLQAMRNLVFGFGPAQMALTALGTGLVTWAGYGQGWRSGVAVGLAVAMSSTAIVARMLSDRFELHSRSGRQTMGVLLFQDLAVAPCLILLPALATTGDDLWRSLTIAAAQTAAVLALLIWVGQRLMGRIYDAAAAVRSGSRTRVVSLGSTSSATARAFRFSTPQARRSSSRAASISRRTRIPFLPSVFTRSRSATSETPFAARVTGKASQKRRTCSSAGEVAKRPGSREKSPSKPERNADGLSTLVPFDSSRISSFCPDAVRRREIVYADRGPARRRKTLAWSSPLVMSSAGRPLNAAETAESSDVFPEPFPP